MKTSKRPTHSAIRLMSPLRLHPCSSHGPTTSPPCSPLACSLALLHSRHPFHTTEDHLELELGGDQAEATHPVHAVTWWVHLHRHPFLHSHLGRARHLLAILLHSPWRLLVPTHSNATLVSSHLYKAWLCRYLHSLYRHLLGDQVSNLHQQRLNRHYNHEDRRHCFHLLPSHASEI